MGKDPAALLYIDTWKAATTEMTAVERAYYMDLILHQYDKGSLPNDIEELANICRVRFSEFEHFKQVFEQVLKQKFELNEDNRLENSFAREIIKKRQSFKDKRSNAGKLSYVMRYFRKNHKVTKKLEQFIKDNIDLDFDIKNEQVLKQVFEQISELYINENEDGIKDIDKSKDFYKKEIEANENKHKIENYRNLVNFLFATNPLEKPLTKVLSMGGQISYKNYLEFVDISKSSGIDIRKTILALENTTARKYKTFSLTLRNWIDK